METPSADQNEYEFGAFRLDVPSTELVSIESGTRIRLQEQPFRILLKLVRSPGAIVSRDELRHDLWGDDTFVDFDNGLNIAVKKLRAALGDEADAPRYIETVPRRGYRLIAPVHQPAPPAAMRTPHNLPYLRAVALLLAVIFVTYLGWEIYRRSRPASNVRSLAVLPLANLSGDSDQEYFADGMTEELITDLAQIHSLRVISRTSSMHYKGTRKTLPEIARELNVDAVLEGGLSVRDGRVRVTAQLVDARTDRHLWASSYEEDLKNVLEVQQSIARAVAQQVRTELTPDEKARLHGDKPVDPAAHDAYLKGRYQSNKLTQDALAKGLALFDEAIHRDPSYAAPYAGIAFDYLALADWTMPAEEALSKAKSEALKALALNDEDAGAHTVMALVHFWYDRDQAGAESEFRRALSLNSNDASVHQYYGAFLVWTGRFQEGIEQGQRAVSLDPISVEAMRLLADDYYFSHHYEQAIAEAREAVSAEPNYWFAHLSLGRAYAISGDPQQAISELDTARRLEPHILDPLGPLGYALAKAGDRAKARSILRELEARSRQEYVSPFWYALVYSGLGEKHLALAWLEETSRQRSIYASWFATEPMLDQLRSDPAFQSLQRSQAPHP